jgi:hypothetical protein
LTISDIETSVAWRIRLYVEQDSQHGVMTKLAREAGLFDDAAQLPCLCSLRTRSASASLAARDCECRSVQLVLPMILLCFFDQDRA